MKKKLSSLFIALALCLTMAQPALARETGENPQTQKPEANNGPRLSEQYENEPQENLPSLCDYINDLAGDGI